MTTSYRKPFIMKQVIERYANQLCKNKGIHDFNFILDWNSIVGLEIANLYNPLGIIKIGKSDVLRLHPLNRRAKTDFKFWESQIINKVNLYLGSKVISKIKLEQFHH